MHSVFKGGWRFGLRDDCELLAMPTPEQLDAAAPRIIEATARVLEELEIEFQPEAAVLALVRAAGCVIRCEHARSRDELLADIKQRAEQIRERIDPTAERALIMAAAAVFSVIGGFLVRVLSAS
jgi:hypothetical protein